MSHDLKSLMEEMGRTAREATAELAKAASSVKDKALRGMAIALRESETDILTANEHDLQAAEEKALSAAMIDRLKLDHARIEAIAASLEEIASMNDPIGEEIASWERPNGLAISRIRVPLGVIGIIYESRPNVTADAGALCLKSGNAVILRGGSESFHSSKAIHNCLVSGLKAVGLPEGSIQLVSTTDREAVGILLRDMTDYVDVIVPRGGKSLISRVQADARVPVMGHLEGLCHIYVDETADIAMACDIVRNAKMRRTGICGAAETLLIAEKAVASHLGPIADALIDAGCEIRGDAQACQVDQRIISAREEDWSTEYLEAVISLRIVKDVSDAIDHITKYGSGHTECIISEDTVAVEKFMRDLDSAILMHNASTQFADGGEFGLGAEIGIATGKLHARGPVGAAELTSYKYIVHGSGQTRP